MARGVSETAALFEPFTVADDLRVAMAALLADRDVRALADMRIRMAELLWGDAPDDWAGFIAFATQAGVSRSKRYEAAGRWGRQRRDGEWHPGDPVPRIRTALYRLFGTGNVLLYVGITDHLRNRMRQHAAEQDWWPDVTHRTVAWYDDRDAADLAETLAIAVEQPVHNKAKVYAPRATVPF
jgi:predicted GIY-YIG superfamily endonuclease